MHDILPYFVMKLP